MANARNILPAYEVEFIPIERRLDARRKMDRDPRLVKIGLAYPKERRRAQRRTTS